MALLQILDLSLFIDELTLEVVDLLLGDDPVIVDFLPLLLEEGHQFLLLFYHLFQLPQLLSHLELVFFGLGVLDLLGLVDGLFLLL